MRKIKIYVDNSANIKSIKHHPFCIFVNVPYDKSGRRTQLVKISDASWEHLDLRWEELPDEDAPNSQVFTFKALEGSEIFEAIIEIVVEENSKRIDVLHLDSAFKEKVEIFFYVDSKSFIPLQS